MNRNLQPCGYGDCAEAGHNKVTWGEGKMTYLCAYHVAMLEKHLTEEGYTMRKDDDNG